MLLFLEIWLTAKAWRRGWNGWALAPLVAGLIVAFLLASSAAGSGTSAQDLWAVGLIGDLLAIVGLILMVANPRTEESRSDTRQTLRPPEGIQQEGH